MKIKITYILLLIAGISNAQDNIDELLKQHNDNGVPYITVEELAMPKNDAILLDSREPKEFKVSHLKGATCVGYDNFKLDSVTKQFPNKDQEIVVYCSLGIRSETIAEKLKEAGYTNVKNLYGGIFEWKNKDLHTFNKDWSKWLEKGTKVYEKKKKKKRKKSKD